MLRKPGSDTPASSSLISRILALVSFCWATCTIVLHMWHSHKLLPRGFGVAASIQQLERELTFGPNFGSFWFAHLSRMIACFLFFLGAWAIGQSVFPWFLNRSSGDDRARLGLPFSIGLGLGVLGYLSFALSMCGLTQRWIVSSLYLAICSFGIWRVIPAFRISRSARGTVAAHSGPSFLEKTTFAVFIALIAMAFLGSTSPEIFYDSLTYHLAVPQTYLFAGKIVDMPYNHYSYLPLLISMLYFWGLAVGGMYLAKLMSFSLGLCVLLGLYQWGKVLGGRAVGIIACTVFMGTPLVLYLFWVCNSDLGMAFFLLLALMATWRWSCELETNQRMLYLAGIFAGLAVASKYTAVVGVVVLMAFVAWRSWRKRPAAPFLFFLVAMMPLIPWWIRTYEFTGNPFFPYLVSAFGPKDADQSLLALWYQETRAGTAGIHPFVIMKKIWTDAIYGALPPLNYTGAIFVAFSPIILFVQQMPWMRFVSLYCCITLLAGLSMTHITRLLVPFYLPLSLVVAFALISERHRYARAASVLLISALLFNTHRFVMVMLLTSLKGLSVATI